MLSPVEDSSKRAVRGPLLEQLKAGKQKTAADHMEEKFGHIPPADIGGQP